MTNCKVLLRISNKSFSKLLTQTIEAIKYNVHLNEVLDAVDTLIAEVSEYIHKNKVTKEKVIDIEIDGYLASTIYCGLTLWQGSIKSVTQDFDVDFCTTLEEWNKEFYKSCIESFVKTHSKNDSNVSTGSRWNGLSMN
jgi:hypothetical protein